MWRQPAHQVGILGDEHFPGAVQIVDDYHAREPAWNVACAVFAAEPEMRDSWANQVVDLLCEGRGKEVGRASEKLPPFSPEPGKTKNFRETDALSLFRVQDMYLGNVMAKRL
jgi:hypothetical protein